ncbi:MAG: DUF3618 domain-containing protein [Anaerolineae bacterium]
MNYSAEGKDPEQIRKDIRRTREEMGDTVEDIEHRLSPDRLRAEASEVIQEATIGRARDAAQRIGYEAQNVGASLMSTVRRNPIPAAMIGIGLGWLLMESRRGGAVRTYDMDMDRTRYQAARAGRHVRSRAIEARMRGQEMVGQTRERASQIVEGAQQRAGEVMGEAQQRASQAVDQAQEKINELGDQAEQSYHRVRNRFEEMMEDNPLAVGAIALAVGAAIGMAIPETPQEHRLMGETHDRLIDRAQGAAEETMQKVQRVADEAKRAAEEEARQQNLTS